MKLRYEFIINMLSSMKVCYINSLDLSGQNLSDRQVQELVQLLQRHPEITSLNLTGNQIGVEGARALAANTTLTHLKLNGNRIGSLGAETLSRSKTLTHLLLFSNRIDDSLARALAAKTTPLTDKLYMQWDWQWNPKFADINYKELSREQTEYRLAAGAILFSQTRKQQNNTIGSLPCDIIDNIFSLLDSAERKQYLRCVERVVYGLRK